MTIGPIPTHKRAGFTLVEIIAVVSITVALFGVLSPVFYRVQDNKFQVTCQDNLRQIGVALSQYAADYSYRLPRPPAAWGSATAQFCSRIGLVPLPANALPSTYIEAISPYLKNRDTYFCPSDNTNSQTTVDMSSYFLKPAVAVTTWSGRFLTRDFGFPYSQILVFERKGFHSSSSSRGWAEGVKLNCVFADGHVGFVAAALPSSPDGADVAVAPVPASVIDSRWNWTQAAGFPCWFNKKGDPNQATAPSGQASDPTLFKDAVR